MARRRSDVRFNVPMEASEFQMTPPAGYKIVVALVAILAVAYVYIWRKGALEWH